MHGTGTTDPIALRNFAESIALSAGRLIRKKWREPREITEKGYRDVVTDADFASQSLITNTIRAAFPDHGFLTEEEDSTLPEGGPLIWIIDPVDGTTNYSRQVPTYCVSIAAAVEIEASENGTGRYEPVAGVIYDPMRDELFSAAAGSPSLLNGRQIKVSQEADLSRAIVCMDWSRGRERRQALLAAIDSFAHQVHTIRATGSAALSLAWVAAGRFEVYLNFGISDWDVAAAAVIIGQAGGILTDINGNEWRLGSPSCIASDGIIHRSFMRQAGLVEQD